MSQHLLVLYAWFKIVAFSRNIESILLSFQRSFHSEESVTCSISIPCPSCCATKVVTKCNSCWLLGQENRSDVSAQYLDNLCPLTLVTAHSVPPALVAWRGKASLVAGGCSASRRPWSWWTAVAESGGRGTGSRFGDQPQSVNLAWVGAVTPSSICSSFSPTCTAESFAYQELNKIKMWQLLFGYPKARDTSASGHSPFPSSSVFRQDCSVGALLPTDLLRFPFSFPPQFLCLLCAWRRSRALSQALGRHCAPLIQQQSPGQ